jgi:cell wall-associated NlpC family hydrolase
MKTNPRLKSFLISSNVLFILLGMTLCTIPSAVAEVNEVSISRSGLDRSEIREMMSAIEAEKKIEYEKIYNQVVQEEEDRIAHPESTQSKFVKFALKFQGTPYWYGGSTPRAFDCSGFVAYVIKKVLDKDVRHSATSQMQLGQRVKNPLPGDLVGFGYGNHFGHIGIYVGNGKVIDALNPYRDIGVRSLDWMESNVGPIAFARIIEPNRNFNPHKITQKMIDSKIGFNFTP